MKLVSIFILLSFPPFVSQVDHEEYSTYDARDVLHQESIKGIDPDIADEVVSLSSNGTDVGGDILKLL